jgi:iron complex transport system substrate-binding protein
MDIYKLAAILGDELDDRLIAVGTSFKKGDIDGYKKFSEKFKNLDNIENIGSIYDGTLNIEKMLELKPDIIIADKYFYEKFDHCGLDKIIAAGLPLVIMDCGSTGTDPGPFHGAQESIRMLGKMLGKEQRANEMIDFANTKTDAILERIRLLETSGLKKPKLYFECGIVNPTEIGPTSGGTNGDWGYVWYKLGADNIGMNSNMLPLNPENVLAADPDVIVVGGSNWDPEGNIMRLGFYASSEGASEHLSLYLKRPGWSDLTAIKKGRLHAIHYNYYGRPYNFAGFETMAKFLYPQEFADLNPEKDLADFFEKYMPFSYSGTFSADWVHK